MGNTVAQMSAAMGDEKDLTLIDNRINIRTKKMRYCLSDSNYSMVVLGNKCNRKYEFQTNLSGWLHIMQE